MQSLLPPETERLWKRLESEPLLAGWYLIGGTALALRIGHRQSEDLDFAWPGGGKLPAPRLAALTAMLETEGWTFVRDDDANAYDEFLIAGMSLYDYQQNFIASDGGSAVKLTFFSPEGPLANLLPLSEAQLVTIPALALLFQAKALVSLQRSASRDWLDLYILMTRHGFTMEDYAGAFQMAGAGNQLDLAFQRLCSGRPREGDPGYETLDPAAPSVQEMAAFFQEKLRQWKQQKADETWEDQSSAKS